MHKDIEYIRQYIGPVFFVNKKSVKYSEITRNIDTCPNPDCPKHQKPVDGLPLFCTECGSKVQMILCKKKYEQTPSSFNKEFYSKCGGVSNNTVNGTNYFMDKSVKLFADDSYMAYVPFFKPSDFQFGIMDNKTFGTFCVNENCRCYKSYTDSSSKYCHDCGHKLSINITSSVSGLLSQDEATSILATYNQSNHDSFQFIKHPEWEKKVDDYSQTEDCKSLISDIEKTYGEGSVTMRLAFVSYHSIF